MALFASRNSLMAKECTVMETELPPCPSGHFCQVVAKAHWRERVGKACAATACSQGRANAYVDCVQHPSPVANLLKYFNHPVLPCSVCYLGIVRHTSFCEQANWPQVKSEADFGTSLSSLVQRLGRILTLKTLNLSFIGKDITSPGVLLWWGRIEIWFDLGVDVSISFYFKVQLGMP